MNLFAPSVGWAGRDEIIAAGRIADALMGLKGGSPALRKAGAAILKEALCAGRAEIARRLEAFPGEGMQIAECYALLTDRIVGLIHGFTMERLCPSTNRTPAERLSVAALGGYGRGQMALHSDVDILFLAPSRRNAWADQRIETMLYLLWDTGLKVGQQSTSLDEMLRLARDDIQVRTALLEARHLCGDQPLFAQLMTRFESELQASTAREFVAAKLAERNARHVAMGDSRYVVEPNVKEGKGGLRDLHALFWIGKYAYRVHSGAELVEKGLLTAPELRRFLRAGRFFWSVRCHLHVISGRAEERLGFDTQREIAARMHYADRPGKSAVERFMQFYFRQAKTVGDLSGVFLAQLDESFAAKGLRFGFPSFRRRPGKLDGFVLDRGRIAISGNGFFADDPVRLVQLFALADRHALEIHPLTMRQATRDARLIDAAVREDARASALFLDVLTSPRDPEPVLRWMNEAGVLGRFVPDFGRIVAQMQFDMYHHYTVDEHTIRALGLLSRIERGLLKADHPLATALFAQISSRRVIYVAVFLHDIAKGRGGDHSVLGEEVARQLCPRLGLTPAESDAVAWLVRNHLLISRTAFKRDLADPKTISDFAAAVQSPERLRLLFLLTVVDIRAVGPAAWTSWKRQLLRTLYDAAEETLRLGHKQRGRREVVATRHVALGIALGWTDDKLARVVAELPESWWIAEPAEVQRLNAVQLAGCAGDVSIAAHVDIGRGATLITVIAPDRPGLFHDIVTAISAEGGNIIDARIYTGAGGQALDNLLVQDLAGAPFADPQHLRRLTSALANAIAGSEQSRARLANRPARTKAAATFRIEPAVLIDNNASNRYTVVEINAADRPALLSDLTEALLRSGAAIQSAHIATYGERAVDVFYLTDRGGAKIEGGDERDALSARLHRAAGN